MEPRLDERSVRLLRWAIILMVLGAFVALLLVGADGPADPYLRPPGAP